MKQTLSFQEKYQAMAERNASYEGTFFVAVKTTGIFCRPGCTARTPKKENVEFYDEAHDAIINGYRPCKVCKPMERADETPSYVEEALRVLKESPFEKLNDDRLRTMGISPNKIRRWFKKRHQMTFQAYQRMLRINSAYHSISQGEKVTAAAFDSGYGSLSGFNSSYKNIFDHSAGNPQGKNVINIVRFTTPLGPMFGCATDKGVCLLEFTNRRMLETSFKEICKRFNAVILPGENKHLSSLRKEMEEYFSGKRKEFSVPLEISGTPFQEKAWDALNQIPYGDTISYQDQAHRMGNPKAVRAVGTANGTNRISIVIPCHRVVGKDGQLTGYGGGLERKKWLLDFERKNA